MMKRKGQRRKGRGECEKEARREEERKRRVWERGKERGGKEVENVRKRKGERRKERGRGKCRCGERLESWPVRNAVSGLLMRGCLHA
jgi:hypothetical protein